MRDILTRCYCNKFWYYEKLPEIDVRYKFNRMIENLYVRYIRAIPYYIIDFIYLRNKDIRHKVNRMLENFYFTYMEARGNIDPISSNFKTRACCYHEKIFSVFLYNTSHFNRYFR